MRVSTPLHTLVDFVHTEGPVVFPEERHRLFEGHSNYYLCCCFHSRAVVDIDLVLAGEVVHSRVAVDIDWAQAEDIRRQVALVGRVVNTGRKSPVPPLPRRKLVGVVEGLSVRGALLLAAGLLERAPGSPSVYRSEGKHRTRRGKYSGNTFHGTAVRLRRGGNTWMLGSFGTHLPRCRTSSESRRGI